MADLAASIAQRLRNHASANKQDFNAVLTRYGLERLLFRLSQSRHAESFLLKGALLFLLWHNLPNRPTRDIDLLGFGPDDVDSVMAVFKEVCQEDGHDAVTFDPASVKGQVIRKETGYGGVRVTMSAKLKNMKLPIQVDVGFGDAVTPEAQTEAFPVILDDLPSPVLRVYPKFTVCAEKLEAITSLGMANTRLKDFYDLWVLLGGETMDEAQLAQAIVATFRRRGTPIATDWPIGLTEEFSTDEGKRRQWAAFTRKNGLEAPPLPEVVVLLRGRLSAPIALARMQFA
jgi:predicted nucleotidyltransferase component of viral defense system